MISSWISIRPWWEAIVIEECAYCANELTWTRYWLRLTLQIYWRSIGKNVSNHNNTNQLSVKYQTPKYRNDNNRRRMNVYCSVQSCGRVKPVCKIWILPLYIPTTEQRNKQPWLPLYIPTTEQRNKQSWPLHIPTTEQRNKQSWLPLHIPTTEQRSKQSWPLHIPTTEQRNKQSWLWYAF